MLQKYYDYFFNFFAVFDMPIGLYAIKQWCDEVPVRFYIYIIMVGISIKNYNLQINYK